MRFVDSINTKCQKTVHEYDYKKEEVNSTFSM